MTFTPDTEKRYFKLPKGSALYNLISEGMQKVKLAKQEYRVITDEVGAYGTAIYDSMLTPHPMFAYKLGVNVPEFMRYNKQTGYYSFNKKHKLGKEYATRWQSIKGYSRDEIIDTHINPNNIFSNSGWLLNNLADFYYFVVNCEKDYVIPEGLIEISNIEHREAVDALKKLNKEEISNE